MFRSPVFWILAAMLVVLIFGCFVVMSSYRRWKVQRQYDINNPSAMYNLAQKLEKNSNLSPDDIVVAEFDLLVSQQLGIDFSKSKRKQIQDNQRAMFQENDIIFKQLSSGTISEKQYFQQMGVTADAFSDKLANILTDYEYKKLFGFGKEVKASTMFHENEMSK